MAKSPSDTGTPEQLGSQAKSILATLLAAREWEARFPGGWVSNEDLVEIAKGFFSKNHDTINRALSRAGRDFHRLSPPVAIEKTRAPESRSERRRIRNPVPALVWEWFRRDGHSHLFPDFLDAFYARSTDVLPSLAEEAQVEAKIFLSRGKYEEALRRLREAMRRATTQREQYLASLLECEIGVRRGGFTELLDASNKLTKLLGHCQGKAEHLKVLLLLSECHLWLLKVIEFEPHEGYKERVAISARLDAAKDLLRPGDMVSRGRVRSLEGLLLLEEARQEAGDSQVSLLNEARSKFLESLANGYAIHDDSLIAEGCFNLGEVEFSFAGRFGLMMNSEEEDQEKTTVAVIAHLHRAAIYFQNSILHAEMSDSEIVHAAAYARAVESLAWYRVWILRVFSSPSDGSKRNDKYIGRLVDLYLENIDSFDRIKRYQRKARILTPSHSWRHAYLASAENAFHTALLAHWRLYAPWVRGLKQRYSRAELKRIRPVLIRTGLSRP